MSKKDRVEKKGIKELLFGGGWKLGSFSDLKSGVRTGIEEGKKPVRWLEKKGSALEAEERERRIRKFRKRVLVIAFIALSVWIWLVTTHDLGAVVTGLGSFFLPVTIYMVYRTTVKSVKGELGKKKQKKQGRGK